MPRHKISESDFPGAQQGPPLIKIARRHLPCLNNESQGGEAGRGSDVIANGCSLPMAAAALGESVGVRLCGVSCGWRSCFPEVPDCRSQDDAFPGPRSTELVDLLCLPTTLQSERLTRTMADKEKGRTAAAQPRSYPGRGPASCYPSRHQWVL
ncbi:hypothetical protein SKAU_G00214670 [Synaphobranchus kaupii]|uniref:Uncharacterized protein n=1 Tax=Synaphobranchus kaupii TaxID=118154 RepID=A0A9Q1F9S8_SYNKA|nr:hypothetical protein SKAU_G00214670 [Synaphobranchus kaupii]